MNSLRLSQYEMAAIKAVDVRELQRVVDEALSLRRTTVLDGLGLASCGAYVVERLRRFDRDLANYASAKAVAKTETTRSRAWSGGSNLVYAVREMQRLVEEQEKEAELLRLDDTIVPPRIFRERIDIRVHFQWRRAIEDSWTFGAITFVHDVDMRPDYSLPEPTRKPSKAKTEEERQTTLYRHWEHLRTLALHAVREFLKAGGDASQIPDTFQAKTDGHSHYLNNFSCDFWKQDAGP